MRNSYTTTQIIAKEGWNRIVLAFMVFLLSYALSFFSWLFFAIFLGMLYGYRNPERIAEEDDARCIIAPLDGKITNISKISLSDGSDVLRIVIRKSFWDVGILRAPIGMEVTDVKNRFGFFMDSSSTLFDTLCERKTLTCKTAFSPLKIVISVGILGQKIDFFQKTGLFKTSERIGFLRDGELALLVPLDTRVKVVLNNEVKAGVSILGYLSYKDKDDQ